MFLDSSSLPPHRREGPYPVWRRLADTVDPTASDRVERYAGAPGSIVTETGHSGDGVAGPPGPALSFSALDLDDPVVTMLLFKQVVTMDDVDRACRKVQDDSDCHTPGTLWRTLAEEPGVHRDRVYAEAAATAGFSPLQVDPESARKVMLDHVETFSEQEWKRLVRLGVLPVMVRPDAASSGGRLVFASYDPSRPEVARLLRQLDLGDYDLGYAAADVLDAVLQGVAEPEASEPDASPPDPENDSVGTLFETCLTAAVRESATAVHVRPSGRGVRIDFRVDGRLTPWLVESDAPAPAVFDAFKGAAQRIDPTEHDAAQSGAIFRTIDGRPFRFAVSVMPVQGESARESLAIRIHEKTLGTGVEDLGLSDEALEILYEALGRGRGLIVVAGPVDAGKSETEEALLHDLASRSELVVTLEDGVDAQLDVLPIRLNSKLSHEDALQAVARHDPDVVVVGELTQREEVERAMLLAKDGHLVIGRMAVRDGSAFVERVTNMGIEPLLTAHALELVLSQRRIRRLCHACKVPATHVDGEMLRSLGFASADVAAASFAEAGEDAACPHCAGSGYDGPCLVAEAMPVSKALRRRIALADFDGEDIRQIALREGMRTMRAAARAFVAAGETTVEELIRVAAGDH